jgi:hypothetical protein
MENFLNSFKNAFVAKDKSAEKLVARIKSVNVPIEVVFMYHDGANHVAIIRAQRAKYAEMVINGTSRNSK